MLPGVLLRACVGSLVLAGLAGASGAGDETTPSRAALPMGSAALEQRITVDLRGHTLREALEYLAGVAGLDIEPMWAEADGRPGLDPEAIVMLRLKDLSVREAVERILADAPSDAGDQPTWQVGAGGTLEVGPRSRLNSRRRIETYSIADLIRETPDFRTVPTIDLAAALESGPGGSIFREDESGAGWERSGELAETPAERLVRLITTLVEPSQWRANGGEGASIYTFNDTLIIDAPGYIHRQIGGAVR